MYNIALAASRIDGVIIPPGGTFSLRGISLGSSILSESTTSFPGGITGEYHVGTCGNCGSSNVLVGDCGICTGCEKDMAA